MLSKLRTSFRKPSRSITSTWGTGGHSESHITVGPHRRYSVRTSSVLVCNRRFLRKHVTLSVCVPTSMLPQPYLSRSSPAQVAPHCYKRGTRQHPRLIEGVSSDAVSLHTILERRCRIFRYYYITAHTFIIICHTNDCIKGRVYMILVLGKILH